MEQVEVQVAVVEVESGSKCEESEIRSMGNEKKRSVFFRARSSQQMTVIQCVMKEFTSNKSQPIFWGWGKKG